MHGEQTKVMSLVGLAPVSAARWWHQRITLPDSAGLPKLRLVLMLPAALLAVLMIFTILGITGSSIGIYHDQFSTDSDPQLVSGEPRPIRGDEWYTQTGWTISQVAQGLPGVNQTLPGGMDATVLIGIPSSDWSVAFRPHLTAFWVLPLEQAMAVKWWLPAFAMIAACYVFLLVLWPRRPGAAAAMSIAFFFAPFIQWWYVPATFWPFTWAFLVMGATVWLLKSTRLRDKIVWAGLLGYATVTLAMELYVPFIVPAAFVALTFGMGAVLQHRSIIGHDFFASARRMLPIFYGGLAGVLVTAVWLATRWETIEILTNTVYPGTRLEPTGELTRGGLVSIFGASFSESLMKYEGLSVLGPNSSESSTFFLVGVFLLIPLTWLVIQSWRRSRHVEWLAVAVMLCGIVFVAFLLVPGWDAIAHLLQLDRVTAERMRSGLGLLSLVLVAIFVHRADAVGRPVPYSVLSLALLVTVSSQGLVLFAILRAKSAVIDNAPNWMLLMALLVAAVLLFTWRQALAGSLVILLAATVASSGVNPIYKGMYDLKETEAGKKVLNIDHADPGSWVGVGDRNLASSILVHSGVRAYNGFQSLPPAVMWEQIDPAGRSERAWNRLANISWLEGEGWPEPFNPQEDQVRMTFDACADFAQENVDYVLSEHELQSSCLDSADSVTEGPTTLWLYDVEHQ